MSADEQWPIPVASGIDAVRGYHEGRAPGQPKEPRNSPTPDSQGSEGRRPTVSFRSPSETSPPVPSDKEKHRPAGAESDARTGVRQSSETPVTAVNEDPSNESRRAQVDAGQDQGKSQFVIEYHYHSHNHYYEPTRASEAAPRGTKTSNPGCTHGESWPA